MGDLEKKKQGPLLNEDEEDSGYVYNKSTNTFTSYGNVSSGNISGSAGYKSGSVPTIKNVNSKQAVVVNSDNSIVVNSGAIGNNDKLTISTGKVVQKQGDKKNNLAMFGDGSHLEKTVYTYEKEDKGRKDNYENSFSGEKLKEEQKWLREYNKEKEEKYCYSDADGDTQCTTTSPTWRRNNDADGLSYSISTVLNCPSLIRFEGYLLYEKPIDIDKYVKSVDNLSDEIDSPVKKVKANTEAFVANTTTDNDNSAFDDQAKAERNKLNQAITNVDRTGEVRNSLVKELEEKKKEFKLFNDNLRFLKRGMKLKMLKDKIKEINDKKTLLRENTKYEYYSTMPRLKRESVQISDTEKIEYELKHTFTKKIEPEPGTYGFAKYRYTITVFERTYLYIKNDDIMPEVTWENRDRFKKQIEILEERMNKAGRGYEIPYKSRNIVDMDDKNGEWYSEE